MADLHLTRQHLEFSPFILTFLKNLHKTLYMKTILTFILSALAFTFPSAKAEKTEPSEYYHYAIMTSCGQIHYKTRIFELSEEELCALTKKYEKELCGVDLE